MKVKVNYKYTKSWIPPRCRKPRPGVFEDSIEVELREVEASDAPWACIVYGSRRYSDMVPINPLRYHDGNFYERAMVDVHIYTKKKQTYKRCIGWSNHERVYEHTTNVFTDHVNAYQQRGATVDEVIKSIKESWYEYYGADANQESVMQKAEQFILVNGEPWKRVGEPRYVVQTFGLGHNHGGTAWFVAYGYNNNIPNESYFNANDFEPMVEHFFEVALGRGDTNDAHRHAMELRDKHPYYYIDVLRPELFTCCPRNEHGDGNPFMRRLYGVTQMADNASEAGLLALTVLGAELAS